jgi:hypothetical protein
MSRVTAEHVQSTRKAVIIAERSTNRGITDTLSCLLAMQGERTDARVFIQDHSIEAMKLMTESLEMQLASQAKIARAHGVMTDMIGIFEVPGYGPGACVPNEPGNGITDGGNSTPTALVRAD